GVFQLSPTPPKKPDFACAVTANVKRVRFSVFDTRGGNVRSTPRTAFAVSIVAVSPDNTLPLSSAVPRPNPRDGSARPPPQRNAPVGISKSSGLARHS